MSNASQIIFYGFSHTSNLPMKMNYFHPMEKTGEKQQKKNKQLKHTTFNSVKIFQYHMKIRKDFAHTTQLIYN